MAETTLSEGPSGLETESSGALTSFTLLPKLPTELRLKIFKLVEYEPRTVRVTFRNADHAYLVSKAPIPGMLHACKESQEEALKVYQFGFGPGPCEAKVYFNFHIDTLYFGPSSTESISICYLSTTPRLQREFNHFLDNAGSACFGRVQRLVIAQTLLDARHFSIRNLHRFHRLRSFTKLNVFKNRRDNGVTQGQIRNYWKVTCHSLKTEAEKQGFEWNYPEINLDVLGDEVA